MITIQIPLPKITRPTWNSTRATLIDRTPLLLLILILVLALVLRLTDVGWDADSRLHPDERFMTSIVSAIGNPDNLTDEAKNNCPDAADTPYGYFDTACSAFNPDNVNVGSYAYGTLPLFIIRGAAQIAVQLNPGNLDNPQQWASYDYIHLVGRVVDALADTLVVLLIYLIGLRLFGKWHGLIAAALYACAVLPIQLAHFWTVDPLSNLFFVLGLYAAVNVAIQGRFRWYVLFGVATGCAVASRINLLPMAALLPLAVAVRLQSENRLLKWRTWILLEGILIAGGLVVALLVFRVTQPYAFVGPTFTDWTINPRWQKEIQEVSDLSRVPTDGWPPSVQWFGRIKFVYPWFQMAMWGMGLIAGITVTLALIIALINQLFQRRFSPKFALLSLWVVGYFALTGNIHQMTMRYYLPMYPALFLLAAWLLVAVASFARSPVRRLIVPALVVGATVIAGVSFVTTVYTQPLTRVEATTWINSTLPTTIDFASAEGSHVPADLQHDSGNDLQLETAYNDETYISEPFDLQDNQTLKLDIQFDDPRPTTLTLQLLDTRSDPATVLKEFNLQTDASGHVEIAPDDMPPLAAGSYQWHIGADWNELLLTGGRGMLPPVILRRFMPIMEIGSEDSVTQKPVNFRTPYQSVPYLSMGSDQPVTLSSDQAVTVTEMTFAHIRGTAAPITLTLDDQQYTATPADAVSDDASANTLLGARQRYVLDRPLELEAHQTFSMQSETPLLFTGTALVTDGDWDDSVPTRYCSYATTIGLGIGLQRDCMSHDSYAAFNFTELKLNMAENDSDVKYRRMVDILTKGDYMVISSNRFYDALPRVQRRFAMSSEYYDRLFGDSLNYTLLNTFERGSNFLGIQFPDQVLPTDPVPKILNELEAEEAFTVYDHPTVFVFQNTGFERRMLPDYSAQTTTVSLPTLAPPTYQLATKPQTDSDVRIDLIAWVVGFVLLGWISFPLMYALFPSLPLHGFAFGRALAWLLLAILPWWLTSVLGRFFWTQPGLWVIVGLFVALNALIAFRRRVELRAYLRANGRLLAISEGLFLVALAGGLLLRAVNPDLWQIARGGEKPMDFTYLNAVLRTPVFPPPNPWMAGFPINYYYFGFVIAALPIKLGGIASEIGYNLVLATLYGTLFSVMFTLAYTILPQTKRLTRAALALVGALYAMVAGNLGTLKQILDPEPGMEQHRWYWYPTRILGESANYAGGAINEMPLFSFLFGDLHAHIIGLLPTTLFMMGMWALYKQKQWWIALIVGVIAGAIYMTNIWDVLLYAPLGAVVLWLATRKPIPFLRYGVLVAVGALVTVLPYQLHFSAGSAAGLESWDGARSLVGPFVLVWGIPIGISILWMVRRAQMLFPMLGNRALFISIALIIVAVLFALQSVIATSVLCLMLVGAAVVLAWRDAREVRAVYVGIAVIFGILLAIEYVVVSGDVGRMNTVFKISFQLWIWVALLIPLVLYWTLRRGWRVPAALMLLLIGAGLLYPFFAVPARYAENLSGGITLDGDRFFPQLDLSEGSVTGDLDIIYYLREHAAGFPVVAEWYESEYLWNSRFSVQTGLPNIVGWGNHMRQQYGDQLAPQVDQRIQDVQTLFSTGNLDTIRSIIKEYGVEYITIGRLERVHASLDALNQFKAMAESGELETVFTSGDSLVYHVVAK